MSLGVESESRLSTCRPELQTLIRAAADGIDRGDLAYAGVHDLVVQCGRRGREEQERAFDSGTSKDHWPDSHHNVKPGEPEDTLVGAVDVTPYPEMWMNREKLAALHAYIAGLARGMGINLRGISWDLPHIELA